MSVCLCLCNSLMSFATGWSHVDFFFLNFISFFLFLSLQAVTGLNKSVLCLARTRTGRALCVNCNSVLQPNTEAHGQRPHSRGGTSGSWTAACPRSQGRRDGHPGPFKRGQPAGAAQQSCLDGRASLWAPSKDQSLNASEINTRA